MTYVIRTHRLPEKEMAIAIEPQGAIESAEAAELLRARFSMVLAATEPERIVVDLSAVPSISEAGLDAVRAGCVRATNEAANVGVVHAAPEVRDKLHRRGLTALLS